ncbi:MAG: hypothetical protein ACR2F2_08500 [Pyrinomonadaceae bacterium]
MSELFARQTNDNMFRQNTFVKTRAHRKKGECYFVEARRTANVWSKKAAGNVSNAANA